MNKVTINPEETLIYKELKSKFEVSDPELWKEVSENIKQVFSTGIKFSETTTNLLFCFAWDDTYQGYAYWKNIFVKQGGSND